MAQKKGTYKKRTYKRRYKKASRRKYYRKRKYNKTFKKPEMYITENQTPYVRVGSDPPVEVEFTDPNYGVGRFVRLTPISAVQLTSDIDAMDYKVNGRIIDGRKIRLQYLVVKGYIRIDYTDTTPPGGSDFNCNLFIFRRKTNPDNLDPMWSDLINNTNKFDVDTPASWSDLQKLDLMYSQDWRNDLKRNWVKYSKSLYRKYDDTNNIIPFKMRINLKNRVLTAGCRNSGDTSFIANVHPLTNGMYFTYLSNYGEHAHIHYKWKLYYTDY